MKIEHFCSDDLYRQNMRYPFVFEDKFLVATNGHILIWLPKEQAKYEGPYSELPFDVSKFLEMAEQYAGEKSAINLDEISCGLLITENVWGDEHGCARHINTYSANIINFGELQFSGMYVAAFREFVRAGDKLPTTALCFTDKEEIALFLKAGEIWAVIKGLKDQENNSTLEARPSAHLLGQLIWESKIVEGA